MNLKVLAAYTARAAVLTGVFTALAACTATSPGPASPAAEEGAPKYGGTLVVIGGVRGLDIHREVTIDHLTGLGQIHRGILAEDTQNRETIVGDLAESWQMSPDGKTFTFKIRQLTTHKGRPFNAEDAAYNLNRFLTLPNGIQVPRMGCFRDQVESARATDASTLVVNLKRKSSSFVPCISVAYLLIQPKYVLEEIDGPGKGRRMQPEDMDGVGPFKFVEWVDQSHFEVERFDNYYKKGLPYLDRIRNITLPDAASQIAAFRTQRVHMFGKFAVVPKPSEVATLRRDLGEKVVSKSITGPGLQGFYVNFTKPPLDNARVREAIDLAYNRQNESALLMEGEGEFSGPYACMWGWIFTCQEFASWPGYRANKTEDLAQAKKLLQEAGYTPGSLTLSAQCGTNSPDNCDVLQQDLKEIGVTLRLQRLEGQVLRAALAKGDFQMTYVSKGSELNDPDGYNGLLYLPLSSENYSKWQDTKFLQLHEQQQVELDQAKRGKILRDMGKIVFDSHFYLHGMQATLHQTWWSCVKGYVAPPSFYQTNYVHDHLWLEEGCRP